MFYLGTNGPTIEKDPEIQKLWNKTIADLNNIAQQELPKLILSNEVEFVSVEKALKELIHFKQTGTF